MQVIHKVDTPEVVGGCGIFLALIHDPLKHLGPILVLHRDDHLVKVKQGQELVPEVCTRYTSSSVFMHILPVHIFIKAVVVWYQLILSLVDYFLFCVEVLQSWVIGLASRQGQRSDRNQASLLVVLQNLKIST